MRHHLKLPHPEPLRSSRLIHLLGVTAALSSVPLLLLSVALLRLLRFWRFIEDELDETTTPAPT